MEGIGVPAGGSTGRRPLASLNCSARESSREEKSSAAEDLAEKTALGVVAAMANKNREKLG